MDVAKVAGGWGAVAFAGEPKCPQCDPQSGPLTAPELIRINATAGDLWDRQKHTAPAPTRAPLEEVGMHVEAIAATPQPCGTSGRWPNSEGRDETPGEDAALPWARWEGYSE